ncbi:peptidoglycan D,D-transpeptidase FtsI family protein [Marilutibacter alkalisoli]|uniref:Peptidoglycan D,D-transpeptidase FtsI n=1 Tax=Marilutibacter alkalisoli TaxID=2591633 RepID=A0A514BVA1_9GAMM|nr:penicillin-binding transpeptidase domain-containing protein [Lysobacter alkalisoli]QDH70959.1 penicillin-binding protein 2 [Lysobacter alkalisoli]
MRDSLVERAGDLLRGRQGPGKPRSRARYNPRNRLLLVGGVLGLCSIALVARAFTLQVVNSDFYIRQGDERILREIAIPTSRGMITDRNGEPLAVSTPVESIWGNPKELLEVPDRVPELAALLDVPADELTRKLSQRATREFMYLRRRINPDQAREILSHNIPGVYSQREFRRFYPQGEALAHVLGFTNVDDRGQEGLELAFDEWLSGQPGSKRVIRDSRGRIVENVELIEAAQPGHELVLTLDRRIQYLTFRELRATLQRTGASSGSAVVLDVATGEILAMANLPTYNPNALGNQPTDARRNRAVTDVIEPGSTMKPLTVAAALEAGVITPKTVIDTSPGWMPNGRFRTSDFRNYGVLDTTGVITKSSNVGVSKIVHRMGDRPFYDFLSRMGYGRSTRSGFPGESSGVLPEPAHWSGTHKQTMSYGYALSATPLQIAVAYATLANGGKRVTPTFVKGQHGKPEQVLDPRIAREVLQMMQTVTEPGGTATQAAILGYHVAGKTGTARKFNSSGGYSRRYISFFAGVVPVDNPRFSMVVVIDDPDPGKGYYGGFVSAPMFKTVMDGALRLMDVPPDDIETWLAVQAAEESKQRKSEGGAVAAAGRGGAR